MKIFIDARNINKNLRGLGLFAANIIAALSRLDSRNEYIVFGLQSMPAGHNVGDNFSFVRTFLPFGLSEIVEIPYLVRKYRPDLVWFLGNNCALFISDQIKVVSTVHDLMFFEYKENVLSRHWLGAFYRRIFTSIAIKRADFINTVSSSTQIKLVRRFNLSAERVVVTYNGLGEDIFEWKKRHEDTGVMNDYVLEDNRYLYTISGTSTNKNLRRLIKAFLGLDNEKSLKLVVTGVKDKDNVLRDFSDIDMSRVVFTHYVTNEEKYELLTKCRAFVFVSLGEGFGVPPLEALALGKPVLLSDIPVMRELYDGYGNFVDPFSLEGIAKGMVDILNQGYKPRKNVNSLMRKFSWEKSAKKLLEMFNNLDAAIK